MTQRTNDSIIQRHRITVLFYKYRNISRACLNNLDLSNCQFLKYDFLQNKVTAYMLCILAIQYTIDAKL